VGVVGTSAQTPPPAQTPPAQTPAGQATTAPQQPTFRSSIDSVSVDVTVIDKQGRPVGDLQAKDFEVKENKQVQKIEAFKLIEINDLADPGPLRDILSASDQERELARPGNRLIVISSTTTRPPHQQHARARAACQVRQPVDQPHLVAVMTH